MHTVELDDYEVANLRSFLEWAGHLANTGDWFNQVLYKLPVVEREPNETDYSDRLDQLKRKI